MAFRKHWVNLLYRAATGTKNTRIVLTPIGVTIFGAFTVLFVLAAIIVDRLLDLPGLLPEGARLPASLPLIAAGISITTWSAFQFIKKVGLNLHCKKGTIWPDYGETS